MAAGSTIDRAQRAELAKAARREEILDAARKVFAERGFKGTTIADIADRASIALGTIYLYFASKEDVFAALSNRFAELVTTAVTTGATVDSLEAAVRDRIHNVFRVCGENRDLVRLVILNTDRDSAAERRLHTEGASSRSALVTAFATSMEQGWIRRADPETMARLVFGTVTAAVYQAFVVSGGGPAADSLRSECAEMIIAYLRPVRDAVSPAEEEEGQGRTPTWQTAIN